MAVEPEEVAVVVTFVVVAVPDVPMDEVVVAEAVPAKHWE